MKWTKKRTKAVDYIFTYSLWASCLDGMPDGV